MKKNQTSLKVSFCYCFYDRQGQAAIYKPLSNKYYCVKNR